MLRRTEANPIHEHADSASLINMNITIKNAEEKFVRQFFWDLNEQMTSGKFDFSEHSSRPTQRIYVSKLEAHLTITRLCLKVLNEEPLESTADIIHYALEYLPAHLTELRNMDSRLPCEDKKMICQGLVSFLSEPYYIEHDHRDFGTGDHWLRETEDVQSIRFWLEDNDTLQQLQPKERRWARRAVQPGEGKLGFMKQVALAVGRRLISDITTPHDGLFSWLEAYLDVVSHQRCLCRAKLTNIRLWSLQPSQTLRQKPYRAHPLI